MARITFVAINWSEMLKFTLDYFYVAYSKYCFWTVWSNIIRLGNNGNKEKIFIESF